MHPLNHQTVPNAIDSLLVEKSVSKVISDVPASHLWPPLLVPMKLDVQNGDESMEMDMSSNYNIVSSKNLMLFVMYPYFVKK